MKRQRTFALLIVLLIITSVGLLSRAQTTYTIGPSSTSPDSIASVKLTNAATSVTWSNANFGWTRLVSASLALTNSIVSTTEFAVVRSEGVVDIIATIGLTNSVSSYRWTALNQNDVIIRLGDRIRVSVDPESGTTGGFVYLSFDR